MSEYTQRKRALEQSKCPECRGLGECDDAEPGDISFRTWKCTRCGGTGIVPQKGNV